MSNAASPTLRVRKDVWKLSQHDPWDPIILWYAKGIAEMQTRPLADPTSWRYQAAIHDYVRADDPLAKPTDKLPTDQAKYWSRCQHGSWFFLPWHRLYLGFFEQIVRAAIEKLGGPHHNWALPYWNYSDTSNPNAMKLPPAFFAAKLPDGSPNPLLVAERSAGLNSGGTLPALPPSTDPADDVNINCLKDTKFAGGTTGVNPEFGGPVTKFHHNGGTPGDLETVPHGSVHVAVGGDTGWMSAFNTAGLDPVFWLHHANIDRLWEVWRHRNPGNVNPTGKAWLDFTFDFHDSTGRAVTVAPHDGLDPATSHFGYKYEDISDPFAGTPSPAPGGRMVSMAAERPSDPEPPPEMVGGTGAPVALTGSPTTARVPLTEPRGPAQPPGRAKPRRVFLNIENITSTSRTTSYAVYLNPPSEANPQEDKSRMAGILPMFGVAEASRPDSEHGGSGLTYSLDVTDLVGQLQAKGQWDPAHLNVTFAPRPQTTEGAAPTAAAATIKVGRVSVYYQ